MFVFIGLYSDKGVFQTVCLFIYRLYQWFKELLNLSYVLGKQKEGERN